MYLIVCIRTFFELLQVKCVGAAPRVLREGMQHSDKHVSPFSFGLRKNAGCFDASC